MITNYIHKGEFGMKNFIQTLPLKAMGVGMLALTALVVKLTGGDITAAFITIPMAFALLFSKGINKEDLRRDNQ